MFTEYKVTPTDASQMAAAAAQALSENVKGVNPVEYAARTIAARLSANPRTYLAYGPYWWAVKAALKNNGIDFGHTTDEAMRAEYGGNFPDYAALVAAEHFRDAYYGQFFVGTSSFVLDAAGADVYVLFDEDMEARALGTKGINGVLLSINPDADADDAAEELLDALAPRVVEFEHEAQLWSAHIYSGSDEGAYQAVRHLQETGRMARMIESSQQQGGFVLDSTGQGTDFYVDVLARTVSQAG